MKTNLVKRRPSLEFLPAAGQRQERVFVQLLPERAIEELIRRLVDTPVWPWEVGFDVSGMGVGAINKHNAE